MGFVSDLFGATNNYKAGSPYSPGQTGAQVGTLTDTQGKEGDLARMLMAQANGGGPNPALAQLNQTTQSNVNQANAVLASQRGLNPAMAAKLASDNLLTANTGAAAQAATLRAQQQLGAEGALGGVYGQIANQSLGQQGAINQANMNAQNVNAGVSSQNANTNAGIAGGLLGAGGTAATALLAHGGEVGKCEGYTMKAGGGPIESIGGPKSNAGKLFQSFNGGQGNVGYDPSTGAPRVQVNTTGGGNAFQSGLNGMQMASSPLPPPVMSPMAAVGGAAEPMANPAVMYAAKGGQVNTGSKLKSGGKVPGSAKVPGDSLKNDTVKALLSPGEIVIPRSVTQSKDPIGETAKFVAAVLSRKGLPK